MISGKRTMNKKKPTNFEEFEGELLHDSEIREEYEDLKPKYEMIRSMIKRRNQLHMSQSQLARTVGTKQPAISRLERGEFNNVTLSTLIKVAHALDLDLDISLKTRRVKVTA
jgi:predicted XRE-type DNA-binding protein